MFLEGVGDFSFYEITSANKTVDEITSANKTVDEITSANKTVDEIQNSSGYTNYNI